MHRQLLCQMVRKTTPQQPPYLCTACTAASVPCRTEHCPSLAVTRRRPNALAQEGQVGCYYTACGLVAHMARNIHHPPCHCTALLQPLPAHSTTTDVGKNSPTHPLLPNPLLCQVCISDRAVAKLMGRVFIEQANLNLLGSVLGTPDFFWSPGVADSMQNAYDKVRCSGSFGQGAVRCLVFGGVLCG